MEVLGDTSLVDKQNETNKRQEVYGENGPEWEPVSETKLDSHPYSSIAKIRTYRNGSMKGEGTGWYWQSGLVITAAHVVWGCDEAYCDFRNGAAARFVGKHDIHPKFKGQGLAGSPFDIAVLRVTSEISPASLNFRKLHYPDRVEAAGFPAGSKTLYSDNDSSEGWKQYIVHLADTTYGHSGCPLISNGTVSAIQVGEGLHAQKWQPELDVSVPNRSNAGLAFGETQITFLEDREFDGTA